jgi:hypothetical protein
MFNLVSNWSSYQDEMVDLQPDQTATTGAPDSFHSPAHGVHSPPPRCVCTMIRLRVAVGISSMVISPRMDWTGLKLRSFFYFLPHESHGMQNDQADGIQRIGSS